MSHKNRATDDSSEIFSIFKILATNRPGSCLRQRIENFDLEPFFSLSTKKAYYT